jgi:quercetin dioxygenase-like cupin family protein
MAQNGNLDISRGGSRRLTEGTRETFTGSVMIEPLFTAKDPTRSNGALVSFKAGARSAWHTHPAGQTLFVLSGTGWVQEWGGVKHEIRAGDVVWTPPGVKHWHGGTDTQAMTHLAIQGHVAGKVVEWLEPVSDAQYLGP